MEDNTGSRYALHVALQTLKERCQNLQQRLSIVEEENITLRVQCSKNESRRSITETDTLKAKIVELTEQKAKLEDNYTLVANENKQLWSRLSRLLEVNKTLGSHLTKINESLNQHSRKALIRSNTFTQSDNDAKKAVADNDKISLELEDVSLKLISTIAKEKTELEAQCSEMLEIQNTVSSNSFGFSYLNDTNNDSLSEHFEQHLIDLRNMKDSLKQENTELQSTLMYVDNIKCEEICSKCSNSVKVTNISSEPVNNENRDDELQLESLARWGTPENSNIFLREETTHICPMCSKKFPKFNTAEFLTHVENHFKL